MTDKNTIAKLTADLVSSYVGNKSLSESELEHAIDRLPALIGRVHEALLKIVGEPTAPDKPTIEPAPATFQHMSPATSQAPQQTVFPDHLICLECEASLKTLKRHLTVHHDLTPEAYRKKWSLPEDYPMAAAAYSETRSAIAKKIGLGASGRGGKPAIMLEVGVSKRRVLQGKR